MLGAVIHLLLSAHHATELYLQELLEMFSTIVEKVVVLVAVLLKLFMYSMYVPILYVMSLEKILIFTVLSFVYM